MNKKELTKNDICNQFKKDCEGCPFDKFKFCGKVSIEEQKEIIKKYMEDIK